LFNFSLAYCWDNLGLVLRLYTPETNLAWQMTVVATASGSVKGRNKTGTANYPLGRTMRTTCAANADRHH
jgi:hypothetical protein